MLQLQLPVGTEPYHFLGTGEAALFGPYWLPAGFVMDAGCIDVTGGVLGCISPIIRYAVQ